MKMNINAIFAHSRMGINMNNPVQAKRSSGHRTYSSTPQPRSGLNCYVLAVFLIAASAGGYAQKLNIIQQEFQK